MGMGVEGLNSPRYCDKRPFSVEIKGRYGGPLAKELTLMLTYNCPS